MTSHVGRLYVLVSAILVFFLSWAAVAARPWPADPVASRFDSSLAALRDREQALEEKLALARRLIAAGSPDAALPAPRADIVQVVEAAPVTVTRSS
jgi:hypothetical protein